VFVSYRNGNQPDIYKMDPQGNSIATLTPNSAAYDAAPAWSYDNTRIAMVRRRQYGNTTIDDIYVINADGSNGHWVRATPFPFRLTDPSWSPDGSRIVLSVLLNSGWLLATMNVSNGDVSLSNPAAGGIVGRFPSYDRTGQRIIYVGTSYKTIEQINADGSGRKVRFSSATTLGNPTFSPDGKKIVLERSVGTGYNPEIFVKNLVDGSVKRLTSSAAWDVHPSWSPDGTKIAFASRRSGKSQIYTMSAAGGTATRITHTAVEEFSPAWSH
jgi:TolB protein